ncbi:MAG: biotin/lipoyl-binding protein [Eubacteriales bacterium]|nr:biotin/lipoyl-binding protein [Eubacteriales bacterium]
MRQFNITVNGIGYQVSVEEVAAGSAASVAPVAPAVPVTTAALVPAAVKPAVAKPAAVAQGIKIASPMPGTINDVKCAVGDVVKKGTVLLILEAMKMENEIIAPAEGTVKQVLVAKGASVDSGDLMVVIG